MNNKPSTNNRLTRAPNLAALQRRLSTHKGDRAMANSPVVKEMKRVERQHG